ncbi:TRAP transporter small permease [Mollicutes bacterium LVI A0039]|nr:TRAP transporter small permease [Mollicutes bacterium LVI A0039]
MNFIKSKIDMLLEVVSVGIFSFMTLLVSWQVFTRYILNKPSTQSEILAKYLFVWLVFLGASYVFGKREHMNISYLKDKAPIGVQKKLDVCIEVLVLIFTLCVLVIGGLYLTTSGMAQVDATLKIPMGYIYMVIPISGVITIFYNIYNILEIIKKHYTKEEQ